MRQASTKHPRSAKPPHKPEQPAPVEIIDALEEPDMPFEEGAGDTLEADLRHRMISEAAYYLYAQRGYADGYELDDWLQAEAQVDNVALQRQTDSAAGEMAGDSERAEVSAA